MSQKINIDELISHKDNDYFFDDITGDAWEEFLESIRTSGVIEPIIITQDKVIVSGHQRVRACKALGIDTIEAEVTFINSEDEILKQLIETNIRQRGIGNPNPIKFGRCIKELERIYGIQQGGDRKSKKFIESNGNNFHLKTQEDLAKEFGIDVRTLQNYKLLADMIPEMQDLVDTGIVTPTTARAIVRQLPEDQQRELANQFAECSKKVTSKAAEAEIAMLKSNISDLELQLQKEKSKESQIKEVIVAPSDYEQIKRDLITAQKDNKVYQQDLNNVNKKLEKINSENKELKSRINYDKSKFDAARDIQAFTDYTNDYIRRYGGHVWAFDKFAEIPDAIRQDFIKAIKALDGFAQQMIINMEGVTGVK